MLRHSAAFNGTGMGTTGSKGTDALGSQYVTVGHGCPGLWGWFSGCSTYFTWVYGFMGLPVLFFLGLNQAALGH